MLTPLSYRKATNLKKFTKTTKKTRWILNGLKYEFMITKFKIFATTRHYFSFKSHEMWYCTITGRFCLWPHYDITKKIKTCSRESLKNATSDPTHRRGDRWSCFSSSELLCSWEILRKINDRVCAGTLVIQIHAHDAALSFPTFHLSHDSYKSPASACILIRKQAFSNETFCKSISNSAS